MSNEVVEESAEPARPGPSGLRRRRHPVLHAPANRPHRARAAHARGGGVGAGDAAGVSPRLRTIGF